MLAKRQASTNWETKNMTYATQAEKVINYLSKGNTLTSKQAKSRFKIANLRARITELRQEGYKIGTTPVVFRDTGAHGVAYTLTKGRGKR